MDSLYNISALDVYLTTINFTWTGPLLAQVVAPNDTPLYWVKHALLTPVCVCVCVKALKIYVDVCHCLLYFPAKPFSHGLRVHISDPWLSWIFYYN